MVSTAMVVQVQSGNTKSTSALAAGNGISLCSGLHRMSGIQLKDQFSCGNDYAPKVRKPYTISKQRERWTEEEHKKFLEALKLFGRAWRRIEDYVGTKTAVQIRSHAQKFFSKATRDSNGSNTSPMEHIEIPPPRSKRKPMHSYPRKLANQPHKETIVPEQSVGFNSPKTSILDQENKSPTSVLSTIGSDTLGSTDSGTPNGSSSPVSSVTRVHTSRFILTEPKTLPEEEEIHSSNGLVTSTSLDEQPLRKFELFPEGSICAREDRTEEPTTCQTIKLFGRTVLITDSHRPCSPGMSASKSMASSIYEENSNQTLPCNFLPMESSKPDKECVSNKIEHRTNGALYLMQFQTHNLNSVEAGAATFVPRRTQPSMLPRKPKAKDVYLDSNLGEVQDKDVLNVVSSIGSNTRSINNGEKCDKSENETQSDFTKIAPRASSAFSEVRTKSENCTQGFVPYKTMYTR